MYSTMFNYPMGVTDSDFDYEEERFYCRNCGEEITEEQHDEYAGTCGRIACLDEHNKSFAEINADIMAKAGLMKSADYWEAKI